MTHNQPSRTAEYVAFFRAVESLRPAGRRLFADPYAVCFVSPSLQKAVRFSRMPLFRAFVNWLADRRAPGARTSAIARTRLIDDALSASSEEVAQVVILGAGFDCRAYRLPRLNRMTVFEVDHPATLTLKLACLRQVLPKIPDDVRFVELDFNNQTLSEGLGQAGFDPSRPAVFIWEGVTNYLMPEAVDSVLRFVASCSPGSQLIFTYVHSGILDGSVPFEGATHLVRDVARLGEPWTFGLSPDQAAGFLRERGLSLDRDLSAREYRGLYFGAAARRMKGYDFYHVAIAHVPVSSCGRAGMRAMPTKRSVTRFTVQIMQAAAIRLAKRSSVRMSRIQAVRLARARDSFATGPSKSSQRWLENSCRIGSMVSVGPGLGGRSCSGRRHEQWLHSHPAKLLVFTRSKCGSEREAWAIGTADRGLLWHSKRSAKDN